MYSLHDSPLRLLVESEAKKLEHRKMLWKTSLFNVMSLIAMFCQSNFQRQVFGILIQPIVEEDCPETNT